tara:strand:+ start:67 stop:477 length:411 start_codon:yes stop_codon:yes gene_type:complete
MKRIITCIIFILLVFGITPNKVNAITEELPECVVLTHCVRENFKVNDLENTFKKAAQIIAETARTKIVDRTNYYIHAEAKTKWRRYTDDLLVKAIPEKGIIQVRSESRVGIGDNGVNQKRVDDFANRLMTEPGITY